MAAMIDKALPGFVDARTRSFPRSLAAFTLDGVGIVIGSLLGCAPLTVCLESAAGIREGARTGIAVRYSEGGSFWLEEGVSASFEFAAAR